MAEVGEKGVCPLFVAADWRECSGFVAHWSDVREFRLPVQWAREGVWGGRRVLAVANGAGSDRAYSAVMAASDIAGPLSAVCSIGFCGALDGALAIGDVVEVSEVRSEAGLWATRSGGVSLVSVDHIVATAKEKRALRDTGASVVEMEAGGVARAAAELGIPFYCVRAVSDLAEETFANDFGAALGPDGRFSVGRLVWGAMANPVARFGELIRLGRRTALAGKNLGRRLADSHF